MADPVAPAPAQSAPAPTTAIEASVAADDFQAFEAAQFAHDTGQPLEVPEPDEDAEPTPERPLSKRQLAINDKIRTAVETATREKDAEIARLRASAPPEVKPPPEPPKIALAPPEKFPTFEQWAAKQEKPAEASLEDYLDARDDWRDDRRSRVAAQQSDAQTIEADERERMTRIATSITERAEKDKDFATALSASRVGQIQTISDGMRAAQAEGKPFIMAPSHIIAEELMKSEATLPLIDHFLAHPEDLTRLERMPDRYAKLPMRQRINEHTQWIIRELAKLEARLDPAAPAPAASTPPPKPRSSAPPPPVDLGKRSTTTADPVTSAVKADDFAAFEAAEDAKLAAKRAARR